VLLHSICRLCDEFEDLYHIELTSVNISILQSKNIAHRQGTVLCLGCKNIILWKRKARYSMKTISCIKTKYENNKNMLLFCIIATFIIGLITHAYMYFQDSFSHDSLREFNGSNYNDLKIQAGRFIVPLYRMFVRGGNSLHCHG